MPARPTFASATGPDPFTTAEYRGPPVPFSGASWAGRPPADPPAEPAAGPDPGNGGSFPEPAPAAESPTDPWLPPASSGEVPEVPDPWPCTPVPETRLPAPKLPAPTLPPPTLPAPKLPAPRLPGDPSFAVISLAAPGRGPSGGRPAPCPATGRPPACPAVEEPAGIPDA